MFRHNYFMIMMNNVFVLILLPFKLMATPVALRGAESSLICPVLVLLKLVANPPWLIHIYTKTLLCCFICDYLRGHLWVYGPTI